MFVSCPKFMDNIDFSLLLDEDIEIIWSHSSFFTLSLNSPLILSFELFVSKINDSIILHLNFNNLILDFKSIEILFREWTQLYLNPNLVFDNLDSIFLDYQKQKKDIDKSNLCLQVNRAFPTN
jgi:hypothetical protein